MQKLINDLKNPDEVKKIFNRNQFSFLSTGILFVAVMIIYHFFSDKDFSFLLTLGSIIRSAAFVVLIFKIIKERTCKGLSVKTLQIYAVVFFFRLGSILFYEGYLPYDSTGDWLYQLAEITSLVLSLACIYMILVSFKTSYQVHLDSFGALKSVPSQYGAALILIPCTFFAMFVHPTLNDFWLSDVSWTAAMYLESFAIFPQLIMFQKNKSGEIDMLTSHFVSFLGIARFFHLLFWFTSHAELNDNHSEGFTGRNVGYVVVLAQLVQLILMADYLYFYVKAIQRGDNFVTVHGALPK